MIENTNIDLERSSYFNKRKKLLNSPDLTTVPKIREHLGDDLATVVLKYSPLTLRVALGLETPLKGPGPNLWSSPSDALKGKIFVKPVPTLKNIQALTCKGIMDIGHKVEERFLHDFEQQKFNEIECQKQYLEQKFINKLKAVQAEERAQCESEITELNAEFEDKLQEELTKLELTLKDKYLKSLEEAQETIEKLKLELTAGRKLNDSKIDDEEFVSEISSKREISFRNKASRKSVVRTRDSVEIIREKRRETITPSSNQFSNICKKEDFQGLKVRDSVIIQSISLARDDYRKRSIELKPSTSTK